MSDDDEPEDGLSLFDPDRCRCFTGTCTNRATVDGVCDRCFMEYAALRNMHLTSDEWHA